MGGTALGVFCIQSRRALTIAKQIPRYLLSHIIYIWCVFCATVLNPPSSNENVGLYSKVCQHTIHAAMGGVPCDSSRIIIKTRAVTVHSDDHINIHFMLYVSY